MEKFTKGPWIIDFGFSDWGMPKSILLFPEGSERDYDNVIVEIPSVTPYAIGASRKEIEKSHKAAANAKLIAASPEMYDLLKEIMVNDGMMPDTMGKINQLLNKINS